jgi:hypothetical protein
MIAPLCVYTVSIINSVNEKKMVTVLYTREDSVYVKLGCNCYDIKRDARSYIGNDVIIGHPPCRAWGRLKGLARPRVDEKELAISCVQIIQKNGGILEHPAHSSLWRYMNLPVPGQKDEFGGIAISIDQHWFGHLAKKNTWLYIVGCTYKDLPGIPLSFDTITHKVGGSSNKNRSGVKLKEVSKAGREHTPVLLAEWLIKTCQIITLKRQSGHSLR